MVYKHQTEDILATEACQDHTILSAYWEMQVESCQWFVRMFGKMALWKKEMK